MPAATRPQVRTRGNTAVITTTCTDGDTHQVRFTREEVTASVHNPDADAVVAALGGEPHPCQRAINAFTAAHALTDAWMGLCDIPDVTFQRRRWSHPHTCDSPRCTYPTLAHLTSPEHVAGFYNADPHPVRLLARWLMRGEDLTLRAPHTRDAAVDQVRERYAAWMPDDRAATHGYVVNTLHTQVITPAFAAAAAPLVGQNIEQVAQLRTHGVRVEWLRDLADRVSPRTASAARAANPTLGSALAKARNVPARSVAGFLRAGVVAHFHTYHRNQVTPTQVLQVWHGSDHQHTLAGLLKEGWSVPQALGEYPASR